METLALFTPEALPTVDEIVAAFTMTLCGLAHLFSLLLQLAQAHISVVMSWLSSWRGPLCALSLTVFDWVGKGLFYCLNKGQVLAAKMFYVERTEHVRLTSLQFWVLFFVTTIWLIRLVYKYSRDAVLATMMHDNREDQEVVDVDARVVPPPLPANVPGIPQPGPLPRQPAPLIRDQRQVPERGVRANSNPLEQGGVTNEMLFRPHLVSEKGMEISRKTGCIPTIKQCMQGTFGPDNDDMKDKPATEVGIRGAMQRFLVPYYNVPDRERTPERTFLMMNETFAGSSFNNARRGCGSTPGCPARFNNHHVALHRLLRNPVIKRSLGPYVDQARGLHYEIGVKRNNYITTKDNKRRRLN